MARWQSAIRKFTPLALIILSALLCFMALGKENIVSVLNASWRIAHEDSYFKHYTIPLSQQVAADLCAKYEISASDFRCQRRKVYAIDFYPAIIEYYSSSTDKTRMLSVVQEKIGKYQIAVEKKQMNEGFNYWYWYDFTGDQMFPLIIVFDENGIMIDLRTRTGRDS